MTMFQFSLKGLTDTKTEGTFLWNTSGNGLPYTDWYGTNPQQNTILRYRHQTNMLDFFIVDKQNLFLKFIYLNE
jgi:hypothetical protein